MSAALKLHTESVAVPCGLDALAEQINELAVEFEEKRKREFYAYLNSIAPLLLAAQEQLANNKNGRFGAWIKANTLLDRAIAYVLMEAYRRRNIVESIRQYIPTTLRHWQVIACVPDDRLVEFIKAVSAKGSHFTTRQLAREAKVFMGISVENPPQALEVTPADKVAEAFAQLDPRTKHAAVRRILADPTMAEYRQKQRKKESMRGKTASEDVTVTLDDANCLLHSVATLRTGAKRAWVLRAEATTLEECLASVKSIARHAEELIGFFTKEVEHVHNRQQD